MLQKCRDVLGCPPEPGYNALQQEDGAYAVQSTIQSSPNRPLLDGSNMNMASPPSSLLVTRNMMQEFDQQSMASASMYSAANGGQSEAERQSWLQRMFGIVGGGQGSEAGGAAKPVYVRADSMIQRNADYSASSVSAHIVSTANQPPNKLGDPLFQSRCQEDIDEPFGPTVGKTFANLIGSWADKTVSGGGGKIPMSLQVSAQMGLIYVHKIKDNQHENFASGFLELYEGQLIVRVKRKITYLDSGVLLSSEFDPLYWLRFDRDSQQLGVRTKAVL